MKKLLFVFVLLVCSFSFVSASDSWTSSSTYSLSQGDEWKTKNTAGSKMSQVKTSDISYYDVNTVAKTMYSAPLFRIVNSGNSVRSNTVSTAPTGSSVRGGGNTCTIDYTYYGSVKPAWNQLSTDTIKLKMKIY